jgi:hypothetical protein
MALHRGQRRGYVDLRPPERQFGRMDEEEADQIAVARQRAEAACRGLPLVKRDGVVQVGRARFSVYSGEAALQMRRREAESKRLREGRR